MTMMMLQMLAPLLLLLTLGKEREVCGERIRGQGEDDDDGDGDAGVRSSECIVPGNRFSTEYCFSAVSASELDQHPGSLPESKQMQTNSFSLTATTRRGRCRQ